MPDPMNIAVNIAVFGSGPAGVSAAAALVETGVRVTMFDVGAPQPHSHGECRPRRTPVSS
jgi:2-polyprenyl-6-methoxyphenol hydroxylase-like FAD-dependent oxidoreductase